MPAWLPDRGLLREHHDYGVWATDAAPIYHVAAMLTSMASICADKALLIIRDKPYPLHIWTMLVGRSTADRKTTSAQLAISRVEAKVPDRVKQIYGSPEALVQGLAKARSACATIYVPEGQAFFEQQASSYWRHARGMFMDLYDYRQRWSRALVRETIELKNPRISILAACARPILEHHTKDTDWLGGFLARFLMISGTPLGFKPSPRTSPSTEAHLEQLIWNVYQSEWGTLGCTSGALKVFEDFAREIHYDLDAFPPGIHPSLNRLPETARRLAGLYEMAFHAGQIVKGRVVLVTPDAAEHAVALCRASRDDALLGLGELATAPGYSREVQAITNLIRRAGPGGITRGQLIRIQRGIRSRDLDEITKRLLESGEIQIGVRRTSGRPANVFIHEYAASDAKKLATQMAAAPRTGGCWIPLDPGADPIDISGLGVFRGPPPGVPFDPDDDDAGWN